MVRLGQNNQGPGPRDTQGYIPTAQPSRTWWQSLLPAGEETLDVICRSQAASVALTYFQLLEHIK